MKEQEVTRMVSIDQIRPRNITIAGDAGPDEVTHVVGTDNPDVARFLAQFETDEPTELHQEVGVVTFPQVGSSTHPLVLFSLVLASTTFCVLLTL